MLSAQLLASDELHCASQVAFYFCGQLKEPAVTSSDIAAPTAGTSVWSSEFHPSCLLFDGGAEYRAVCRYLC